MQVMIDVLFTGFVLSCKYFSVIFLNLSLFALFIVQLTKSVCGRLSHQYSIERWIVMTKKRKRYRMEEVIKNYSDFMSRIKRIKRATTLNIFPHVNEFTPANISSDLWELHLLIYQIGKWILYIVKLGLVVARFNILVNQMTWFFPFQSL
jgi:hypothetical protein